MSCGNPEVGAEELLPKKAKFDKSVQCIKCKTSRGNIVIRHAVYCKICFAPLVSTKFRRVLDPHVNAEPSGSRKPALNASGNLLVGYSGGLGSAVLLDVLERHYFPPRADAARGEKGGRAHPRNRRVWERAYVCYVEVAGAFPERSMRDRTEDVRAELEKHGEYEIVLAKLEDAFDRDWWERVKGRGFSVDAIVDLANEDLPLSYAPGPSSDRVAALRAYLSALPTPTAVQSAIATLVRLILLHTARSLACSHLLLGTSLTSLSISLISSIAQGGGFHVPEEMYEEWRADGSEATTQMNGHSASSGGIRVVRPLSDVGMKECAAWAWWHGLRIVGRERLPNISGKQTIGGLTRDFIVGLEHDYPSTVSTITRTCAKLAPGDEAEGTCLLCERPVQRGVQTWKSRIAIRSLNPPDSTSNPAPATTWPPPGLSSQLCYACLTTLTSRSTRSRAPAEATPAELPVWTTASLLQRSDGRVDDADGVFERVDMSSEDLRESIKEFLL